MNFTVHENLAQSCPTISVTLPNEVCLEENVKIANSTDAESFSWDFCEGDLSITPSVFNMPSIVAGSNIRGLSMANDIDGWHLFVTNRSNNKLYRLDFGDEISSTTYSFNDLGNIDGLLNNPEPIEIVYELGQWFGVVHNGGDLKLLRLTFGSSLSNPPSAEVLEEGVGSLESDLELHFSNGNWVAVVASINNSLSMIKIGPTLSSPAGSTQKIVAPNLTGVSGLQGLSIVEQCGNWYGIGSTISVKKIHRFNYGLDLFSTPGVQDITGAIDFNGEFIHRIVVNRDGGIFMGFVTTVSGNLFRLEFNNGIDELPSAISLGSLGLTQSRSLEMIKTMSKWYGFSVSSSGNLLFRIDFPDNCTSSIKESSDLEPEGVSFSSAGNYQIGLIATNAQGFTDFTVSNILVNDNLVPDIQASMDDNLCISNPTQFTSINTSGNIDIYSWDFGDGSPTSSYPNPVHDYSATMGTGSYDVTLTVVSTEGCSNFTQQTIEIFDEPVPDFTFPRGTLCSGEVIAFTNTNTTTNIPGTPGVISYLWDFNGEGSSTDENPSFTFLSGGLKEINLTSSIPGCAPFTSKSTTILEGPVVNFSFNNVCLGDEASFTDLTTGTGIDPDSYVWNFGDGGSSTLINSSHFYNTPGDYNVSLSVANVNCTITDIQTITVHVLPVANFVNDQACIGPVQFTDATTVQSANITEWQWDFGNGEFSEEQNPITQYAQNADFMIQLTATSNFGCVDDVSKNVSVLSAPTPVFSYIQGCLGEPTLFNDETIIADINPVNSYFWEIEDEVYTEMNPSHTFNIADNFTATMTVTTANTCTVVASQEIIIPALPIPNFTYTTACANSVITFEGQTVDEGDPIISRTWDFDGLSSANGPLTQFTFSEPGNYNIGLTTRSTLGCTAFVGKTIQVNEQPVAGFGSSSTFGPPPLSVNFTNQSEDAVSFAWLLNDTVDPFSTDEHAALIFEEEGDFEVTLIAFNEFGCTDTLKQVIEVAFPAVDLVLDEVIPVPNNGKINIVLRGANRGTLTIEGFDILIDINDIPIIETFDQILLKAQPFVHTLNFELPEDSNIELLCVQLELIDVEEPNTDNNLGCINFEPQIIVQDPFPNPVVETVRLNVILPEVNDNVQLTLMNIYGEVLLDESFSDVVTGLNIFDFDVQSYQSGLYIVRIRYDGTEEIRRIRKE